MPKRARNRRWRDERNIYQTLWHGHKGEPGLPKNLRHIFRYAEDAQAVDTWLRHGAVTMNLSRDRETHSIIDLPEREHVKMAGWSHEGEPQAIFDNTEYGSDMANTLLRNTLAATVRRVQLTTQVMTFLGDDRAEFETTEYMELDLFTDQVLTDPLQRSWTDDAPYSILAWIENNDVRNADLTIQDGGPQNQPLETNRRAEACMRWLARGALSIGRIQHPSNDDEVAETADETHATPPDNESEPESDTETGKERNAGNSANESNGTPEPRTDEPDKPAEIQPKHRYH